MGTFMNIKTVTDEMTLGECLNIISEVGFAALPVVDSQGKVIDTFYKADISVCSCIKDK